MLFVYHLFDLKENIKKVYINCFILYKLFYFIFTQTTNTQTTNNKQQTTNTQTTNNKHTNNKQQTTNNKQNHLIISYNDFHVILNNNA